MRIYFSMPDFEEGVWHEFRTSSDYHVDDVFSLLRAAESCAQWYYVISNKGDDWCENESVRIILKKDRDGEPIFSGSVYWYVGRIYLADREPDQE